MDQLEKLLKKLGVSATDIAKAKEDGADIDAIVDAVKADQTEILTAKLKPTLTEELKADINKQALISVQGSLKTKLKRELDLQIPDFRTMEFDAFVDAAKEELQSRTATQTEAQVQAKIKEVTTKLTVALEQVEDLTGKLSAKDQEVENKIKEAQNELHAESNISKAFSAVSWGGKPETVEFVQESLKEKIKSQLIVEKDGTIKNKDGTPVVKDGNVIVKTLTDYVNGSPVVQSLIKQNDARGEGSGGSSGGYKKAEGSEGNTTPHAEKSKAYADQLIAELG